jgi:hypothetical protein
VTQTELNAGRVAVLRLQPTFWVLIRTVAAPEKTTVRALIVDGLRRVLAERKRKGMFRLRKASFEGSGLHPDLTGAPWEKVRDTIYQGRGA